MTPSTPTPLIGIDWGSTHCRAFRFDGSGSVVETRHSASGVGALPSGSFSGALEQLIGDWLAMDSQTPLLLCGMVGSRQGWIEVPYVTAPAAVTAVAARLQPLPGLSRRAAIVPGLTVAATEHDAGDIMRGEETQLFGCMEPHRSEWLVTPGTHSKWIWVSDASVEHFTTYMTGEMFAVLRQHSLIGKVMTEGNWDGEAFASGVRVARQRPDWLHQLFGVRVRGILGDMPPASLPAYLSGLLIGYEIGAALGRQQPQRTVRVIGSEQLARHYIAALNQFDLTVERVNGEVAVSRGLWNLAVAAGWTQ